MLAYTASGDSGLTQNGNIAYCQNMAKTTARPSSTNIQKQSRIGVSQKGQYQFDFLEKNHSSFHCQHQWCLLGTSVHRGDGTQRSAQHWCCLGFVTWADSSGFVDPKFQLFRFRCNLVRPPGACFLRLLGVRSAFPTGCRCTGRRFKEQPSSFTTKA